MIRLLSAALLLTLYGIAPPCMTAQPNGLQLAQESTSLIQRASALRSQHKYLEAIPLVERAITIREQLVGSGHPAVGSAVYNLAWLCKLNAEYGKAEALYLRSIKIFEQSAVSDETMADALANSLLGLADLYIQIGAFERALPMVRRAATVLSPLPENLTLATALSIEAVIYQYHKEYSKAEELMKRSIAVVERVSRPDGVEVATAHSKLAELYSSLGDFESAITSLKKAVSIAERVEGRDSTTLIALLVNLADVHRHAGEFDSAMAILLEAGDIEKRRADANSPTAATVMNNLGQLYLAVGEYARAESTLRQALVISEKTSGPEHPDTGIVLVNLAEVYKALGNYGRAEEFLRRALSIKRKAFGNEHLQVGYAWNNLGDLLIDKGDYTGARQALELAVKLLGPDDLDVSNSLTNLAWLHLRDREYEQAELLYNRALAIREALLGALHPSVAQSLHNLAGAYYERGDFAAAERLFRQALEVWKKTLGTGHPLVALSFQNVAFVSLSQGKLTAAVEAAQQANASEEGTLTTNLTVGSEAAMSRYLNTLQSGQDLNISLHAQFTPKDLTALQLALTTVLQRKGRVLAMLSEELSAMQPHISPADRRVLDELSQLRARQTSVAFGPLSGHRSDAYLARLNELRDAQEHLEEVLRGRGGAPMQPVSIDRVQQAIPGGAVLMEIASYMPFRAKERELGKRRYVAYVLERDGEPRWADLGEAEPIDRLVAQLRGALSHSNRTDYKSLARQLDHLVMEPIRPLLGDAHQLLIAPDGQLNLVPFAALVDEQGRYLVERYTISYLGSGRDLLRLQTPAASRGPALVLANPDFDHAASSVNRSRTTDHGRAESAGRSPAAGPNAAAKSSPAEANSDGRRSSDLVRGFTPLEGTAAEAKALKQLMPEARVLTDKQASKAALQEAAGPRILHIATHGFFLADQPRPAPAALGVRAGVRPDDTGYEMPPVTGENPLLRSGLALAGANLTGKADGILTALEATGLDLWGTQLVVLSACETGVGDVHNGDGVYGLRRALVLAGSRAQVMSLWKVSDSATRNLMAGYYRRLLKGEGRSEALRHEQLAMLKSDQNHPFYWAAFIMSGDPTPLTGQQ